MGQCIVLHAVVCRCRLPSVVVCNARGRSAAAGQGAWQVRRPTLHSGTVLRLRPVRATPCFFSWTTLTRIWCPNDGICLPVPSHYSWMAELFLTTIICDQMTAVRQTSTCWKGNNHAPQRFHPRSCGLCWPLTKCRICPVDFTLR